MQPNHSLFSLLTDDDIAHITALRRHMHRYPELSGEEEKTGQFVADELAKLRPERIVTNLGGHGVAAVFEGALPGPTLLFRSEVDALPIKELGNVEHRSTVAGKAHLCGHDGHAAILLGLAMLLSRQRPAFGRVVLLFQPAEENGAGAAAVISDPQFEALRPDWAFSLHNMPGVEYGTTLLGAGAANCASRGLWIKLVGSTAHAANPGDGVSPMEALAELMPALKTCGNGKPLGPDFSMVTITHANLGAVSYGVAPGEARIMATLRTYDDAGMDALVQAAEMLIAKVAKAHGLNCETGYEDVFIACTNDVAAVDFLAQGATRTGLSQVPQTLPILASEDFGRFGAGECKSAMAFLGAGADWPALHTPEYDFRDALIPKGIQLFAETLEACFSTLR